MSKTEGISVHGVTHRVCWNNQVCVIVQATCILDFFVWFLIVMVMGILGANRDKRITNCIVILMLTVVDIIHT